MFKKITHYITLILINLCLIPLNTHFLSEAIAAPVIKTITVKDNSGQPIEGALVAIGYIDSNNTENGYTLITPSVATDSLGKVEVSLNNNSAEIYELFVEPKSGDVSHAVYATSSKEISFDPLTSSSVDIVLKDANLIVDLKTSSSEPLPIGSRLSFEDFINAGKDHRTNFRILRSGPFGIYIDTSVGTKRTPLTITPLGVNHQDGQTNFALSTVTSPVFSINIYNYFTGALISPDSNNRVNLVTLKKIFNFNIFDPIKLTPMPLDSLQSIYAGTNPTQGDFFNEIYPDVFGNYSAALPQNGSWRFAIGPNSGTSLSKAVYTLDISNGVPTLNRIFGNAISPDPGSTPIHFKLFIGNPNVTGNVQGTDGTNYNLPETGDSGFSVQLKNMDSGITIGDYFFGPYSFETRTPGNYQLKVFPNNVSNAGNSNTNTFQIAAPDASIVQNIRVSTTNINLTITNNGISLPNFDSGQFTAQVMQLVNGNWQYAQINQFVALASSPKVSFAISSPGTYSIRINPQGLSQYGYTIGPTFTIDNNLQIIWPGLTASQIVNTNFDIGTSNVKTRILNPLTNSGLPQGWVTIQKISEDGNRTWLGNVDLSPNYSDQANFSLVDGQYILSVNPPWSNPIPGLTNSNYYVVVSSNGTKVTIYSGSNSTGAQLTEVNNIFTLSAAIANITGKFLDSNLISLGQRTIGGVNSWSNACLQILNSDGVNWNYVDCNNVLVDGTFNLRATSVGKYRVQLQPYGYKSVATTNSQIIDVTSSDLSSSVVKNLGNVIAVSSSILVRALSDSVPVPYAQFEIRQANQFVKWVGADQTGVASIGLENTGTYTFILHANGNNSTLIAKPYTVTASSSVNSIVAVVDGLLPNNGIFDLNFGTQTLRGLVLSPSSTPVYRSQVVARDLNNNQDLWEYQANTDENGNWSMYLPEGKYSIRAIAPWGTTSYGNSDQIGQVTVDAKNKVTLSEGALNLTALAFNLTLKAPYWSGVLYDPTGKIPLSNAHICANLTTNGLQSWNCANTDVNGQWALSKPTNFVSFDSNSEFHIGENSNPQYPMIIIRGPSNLESAGFKSTGATGIAFSLPNSNVELTVKAGGLAASNVWVNVFNSSGFTWYAAGGTDNNGVAKFYISDLSQGLKFQADPSNNPTLSSSFANTTISNSPTAVDPGSGIYQATLDLLTPNLFAIVQDTSKINSPVANSWVDLYNQTTNTWLGGSNSNTNGAISLSVPKPISGNFTYQLNVNPPYQGNTNGTRHTYTLTIDSQGVISIVDQANPAGPSKVGASYLLTLLSPTVQGMVQDPSNNNLPVANSWVTVRDNSGIWLQYGSNTRSNGSFGLPLPTGKEYLIQANPQYGQTNQSASTICKIQVNVGSITGPCVNANTAILQLTRPNLQIHLTDGVNPIRNAQVGVGIGLWNANAQTDNNGDASLFLDDSAISLLNQNASSSAIWLWIDPPFGSNLARLSCSTDQPSTICSTLPKWNKGAPIADKLINATLNSSNTVFKILNPNGSASVNSWVNIFQVIDGNWNWVGASASDSKGEVHFYLSDTSDLAKYVVTIEAPWSQKAILTGGTFTNNGPGYTWSDLNTPTTNFSLSEPNLLLIIKGNDGAVNNNGWVGVQLLDLTGQIIQWLGGFGLDQTGSVSINLPINGSYQLILNPGPTAKGIQTLCQVNTDSAGLISIVNSTCGIGSNLNPNAKPNIITTSLSAGNTSGRVITGSNETPVAGAIVSAVPILSLSTTPITIDATATPIVTSTDSNGEFSMQLDESKVGWQITITPVDTPSDSVKLNSTVIYIPSTVDSPKVFALGKISVS